jgi:assimilatory nitrate reductase catalytic subunit
VFWPCPAEAHPGTKRLFLERFATPDGRAQFTPVQHRPAAEDPCDEYPLYLTTGRVLAQYQTGAQTRRVPELAAAEPEPFVEIHPDTAGTFGIAHGDLVAVATRRGEVMLRARLTRDIRRDTVFAPFHWSGAGAVNALTHAALDPVSRIPEFKVCAARLSLHAASERGQA